MNNPDCVSVKGFSCPWRDLLFLELYSSHQSGYLSFSSDGWF